MKKEIKPLADRVVVRPEKAKEKTEGGVLIPESAKKKQMKGTVVSVGPGTSKTKMTVKKGDLILYGQYAGTEHEEYVIMRQEDILAIL